jgi:hypothetical protein
MVKPISSRLGVSVLEKIIKEKWGKWSDLSLVNVFWSLLTPTK